MLQALFFDTLCMYPFQRLQTRQLTFNNNYTEERQTYRNSSCKTASHTPSCTEVFIAHKVIIPEYQERVHCFLEASVHKANNPQKAASILLKTISPQLAFNSPQSPQAPCPSGNPNCPPPPERGNDRQHNSLHFGSVSLWKI